MPTEEEWEAQREDASRQASVAAVAVVIGLVALVLGGILLASVYGPQWIVVLYVIGAVGGITVAVVSDSTNRRV